MGTGASTHRNGQKDKCENNPDEQKNTTKENEANEDGDEEQNEQNIRFTNDGIENSGSRRIQCIPVVVNNTTNRPKFYYYPNKQVSDTQKETIFITNSQFPYKKPKAVIVRQRNALEHKEVNSNRFQGISNGFHDRSRYSNYHNSTVGVSDYHSDRYLYSKAPQRSYPSVSDRHWSSNHVLPTNSYTPDRVLPHRTVAELRRSSLTCPGAEANFFSGNQYSRHSVEIAPGVNRPPTPSTTAWFPVRRTEDYLVASSLVGGETENRQSDRRNVRDF